MFLLSSKSVVNNLTLKIISLIIGFGVWFLLSKSHQGSVTITVPLCFYNNESYRIQSPDAIDVTLMGRRMDLHALDRHELGVHINGQTLVEGKNNVSIVPSMLFLPSSIKLIHYSPSNIVITVEKKSKEISPPHETTAAG